jgi:DNA-binding transcriptional regulator YiaG
MPSTGLPAQSCQEECVVCGSSAVTTTLAEEKFAYGSAPSTVQLTVTVPLHRCTACDAQYTGGVAEDIRHEAVCRHLGVLTPKEVLAIRSNRGLSRQRFAELTRLGIATLARWESGELIQNAALDAYLRLVARPENFALIESGELADGSCTSVRALSEQFVAARFPTLAQRGDVSLEIRRACTFRLAIAA